MTIPAPAKPPKLPFWRTVGSCYAIVARNFGQLVRMSWLWLLIMLPVYAAVHWWIWPWSTGADQAVAERAGAGLVFAITFLPNIVEIPALASIAVAWHRLVLRHQRVSDAPYLRLDGIVWLYAFAVLALWILGVGPLLFPTTLMNTMPADPRSLAALWISLAAVAAGFTILLLLPRFSLVLPAIALGESLSLADAWRATRGNTWRLAGPTLLCTLPPVIPFVLLAMLADGGTRASSTIVSTISSLAYVLIVTIAVTLLSLAYRHLVLRQESGPETMA
jgi:hypothetical protein